MKRIFAYTEKKPLYSNIGLSWQQNGTNFQNVEETCIQNHTSEIYLSYAWPNLLHLTSFLP